MFKGESKKLESYVFFTLSLSTLFFTKTTLLNTAPTFEKKMKQCFHFLPKNSLGRLIKQKLVVSKKSI